MKSIVFLSALLLSFINAGAQLSPDSFISRFPLIPVNFDQSEFSQPFLEKVGKLKDEIAEEIRIRKTEAKDTNKASKEQMSKQMMEQMGVNISPQDMQKMQSGKMSKAEKDAMANQMLQQKMNMSLDEAKGIKNMSAEGKKAYSEAMATEMMAAGQADANKNQTTQKKNMATYELAQEQNMLVMKMQASGVKLQDQLEEFNKLKAKKQQEYNFCIETTKKHFDAMPNTTLGDSNYEARKKALNNCLTVFYMALIPNYNTILDERLRTIAASADDYMRLEELTIQMKQNTTGIDMQGKANGLIYFDALREYTMLLEAVPDPN